MDILQTFYSNEILRETVKDFLIKTANDIALDRLDKGEDAKSVAEAKKVVGEAFIKLKEMFEVKPEPNIKNQSR